MSDSDNYAAGISPRVRDMLSKCPDYSQNPGECKVYGGRCRCLEHVGRVSEGLLVQWIGNCMRGQAYKRGTGWEELAAETGTA